MSANVCPTVKIAKLVDIEFRSFEFRNRPANLTQAEPVKPRTTPEVRSNLPGRVTSQMAIL